MLIYIPTMGRVGKQYTLKKIPGEWLKRTILVCPPEELKAHGNKERVWTWGCTAKGIANTRQCILDHALAHRQQKVLMLDDDLRFYVKGPKRDAKSETPFGLYECNEKHMDKLLHEVDDMLTDYAHCGIDGREGCQNRKPDEENTRLVRGLGYRADIMKSAGVRFDTMQVMEDFDVALKLLQRGYPSKAIQHYVQNQALQSSAPGGCSSYRTSKVQAASAKELVKRHAPFAKLVVKASKWRGMGEERTDVTVYWKEAYKFGEFMYGRLHPLL